jgi:protein involved in sex pheromone biosynthesis
MVRSIIIFCTMLLFLFGCSNNIEEQANKIVKEESESIVENGELELKVDVNVTEHQVKFIITLANHSNEMKKLEFPTSQKYEIIVTDGNAQEVYRYSAGKMFTQAIEYALIKQGESVQWEEIWEYGNSMPGDYEVEVVILAHDDENLIHKSTVRIPE